MCKETLLLQNKDWGFKLTSSFHFANVLVESRFLLVGLHIVINKKILNSLFQTLQF